jgi:hypothetical protein
VPVVQEHQVVQGLLAPMVQLHQLVDTLFQPQAVVVVEPTTPPVHLLEAMAVLAVAAAFRLLVE